MKLTKSSYTFYFTNGNDPLYLIDLDNDAAMVNMFEFNDINVHIHLVANENERASLITK